MTAELEAHPGGSAWDKNLLLVMSSMLERDLVGRTVYEQSRRRRFRFNPDGLHLNSRAASVLSDLIVKYLEPEAGTALDPDLGDAATLMLATQGYVQPCADLAT